VKRPGGFQAPRFLHFFIQQTKACQLETEESLSGGMKIDRALCSLFYSTNQGLPVGDRGIFERWDENTPVCPRSTAAKRLRVGRM